MRVKSPLSSIERRLAVSTFQRSLISYADYAIAMVDEAVNGAHIGERISVVEK